MIKLVNAERTARGLPPVERDDRLRRAAQGHSEHQASTGRMSHVGRDGSGVAERLRAAGHLEWRRCTENVAWNYADEDDVMKGWMASPCHRANILDPYVSFMGWGRAQHQGGPEGITPYYWTQVLSD